jgi:hypothetical protein
VNITVDSSGEYACTLQWYTKKYIENHRDLYAKPLSLRNKMNVVAVFDRPSACACPRTSAHTWRYSFIDLRYRVQLESYSCTRSTAPCSNILVPGTKFSRCFAPVRCRWLLYYVYLSREVAPEVPGRILVLVLKSKVMMRCDTSTTRLLGLGAWELR